MLLFAMVPTMVLCIQLKLERLSPVELTGIGRDG